MNVEKWLKQHTGSLAGKTVAVTGSTGGLGKALCRYLAGLGADLILLDRKAARSAAFRDELLAYGGKVCCIPLDLSDVRSVQAATARLKDERIDVFIHNAGAYSIPRCKCDTGLDNVFQINFASPYFMIRTLLPNLRAVGGRVVAVGSIAHNYSKTDRSDVDFSTRKAASKVYGNAKRYLMFSLFELFKHEEEVSLAITHPGISFTGITAHYPKWIFAIIKHPMKVIFMKPKTASLSILEGVFRPTGYHEWIGPWLFDVWGRPKRKALRTCSVEESRRIGQTADSIYRQMAQTQRIKEETL